MVRVVSHRRQVARVAGGRRCRAPLLLRPTVTMAEHVRRDTSRQVRLVLVLVLVLVLLVLLRPSKGRDLRAAAAPLFGPAALPWVPGTEIDLEHAVSKVRLHAYGT